MKRPSALGPALLALVAGGAAHFLWTVREITLPFALAMVLAYLAEPALRLLQSRGLRRGPSVAALCLVLAVLLLSAASFTIGRLREETRNIARGAAVEEEDRSDAGHREDARRLAPLAAAVDDSLRRVEPFVEAANAWTLGLELADWRGRLASGAAAWLAANVNAVGESLLRMLAWLFIVPFASFFLMLSGPHTLGVLLELCPRRHLERALHLLWSLDESVGRYFRGALLRGAAGSLLIYAGLSWLGVEYAVCLSLLAGAGNLVPILGPAAAAAAGLLVSQASPFPVSPAGVIGVYVLARVIDLGLLRGFLQRDAVALPALTTLFALCAGGALAGLAGVLLAVPAACGLRVLLRVGWEWYRVESGREPSAAAGAGDELALV